MGLEEVAYAVKKTMEEMSSFQLSKSGDSQKELINMVEKSIPVQDGENVKYHPSGANAVNMTNRKFELSSYRLYPVNILFAQLDCMLQIAERILKIERLCSIRASNKKSD